MIKRNVGILLGLILVVAIGIGIYYQNSTSTGAFNKCVTQTKTAFDSTKEAVPGQIVVGFKQGVNTEAAKKVISSYTLSTLSDLVLEKDKVMVDVKTPEGQEIEWLCKLRQNKQVEFVEQSYVVRAQ